MKQDTYLRPWRIAAQIALLACTCVVGPRAWADTAQLTTRTGHSLGLGLSGYRYDETSVMNLTSRHVALDYSGTHTWESAWPRSNEGWFVRGDLSIAGGKADYRSPISGKLDNTTNWYLEAKALVGKDVDMGSYIIAPYIGLGSRRLFNDLRGTSSTGEKGYRRISLYKFLPIGLTHRTQLADQSQLSATVEYLHLLSGQQTVKLSDVSATNADLRLKQRRGHGIQLKLMNQRDRWSWGPTLSYWNIDASEPGGTPAYIEPRNKTYELGLKAFYHF